MELLSLRTFHMVVTEGGILSASRKLNTVQSNVTGRIKRLEEELETELFYRKGRGLELAPSGRLLFKYAQQLLQLESQANAAMRQIGEHSGELRIGTMETFAAVHLPHVLKSLIQQHSGVKLHVKTNTSNALIEQVLKYKLDCAFVGGSIEHPDLIAQEVLQVELKLVRPKNMINEQLPLIVFREGCAYRAQALAWQKECGHSITGLMELGTLEGILGCVGVGLGCTLMPQWVIDKSYYKTELDVTSIASHLAHIAIVMIQHKNTLPMKSLDTLAKAAASLSS